MLTDILSHQLPTYWKSASNGLVAHIYEHVIARWIINYMFDNDQMLVADYDFWAHTYGTTLFLETRFQTNAAHDTFAHALASVNDIDITPDMIERAASECSCEFSRPLIRLDDTFSTHIARLHRQPWRPLSEFTHQQANSSSSVNTVFEYPGIRLGRKYRPSFTATILEYSVRKEVYANRPDLKALTVLITQAIALNQINLLTKQFVCYDAGDEWAEGSQIVGYRTLLVFPRKHAPSQSELRQAYDQNLKLLIEHNFVKKLSNLLQHRYADESWHYFDRRTLNDIVGGVVIGPKGWREVGTHDNIAKIIDALDVTLAS